MASPKQQRQSIDMNKAIERMKGGNPLVEDAGRVSDYTRETLAMMREASREFSDGYIREMMDSISPEFYQDDKSDDDDASESDLMTLDDGDLIAEAKGWRSSRLTCELVDGFED